MCISACLQVVSLQGVVAVVAHLADLPVVISYLNRLYLRLTPLEPEGPDTIRVQGLVVFYLGRFWSLRSLAFGARLCNGALQNHGARGPET